MKRLLKGLFKVCVFGVTLKYFNYLEELLPVWGDVALVIFTIYAFYLFCDGVHNIRTWKVGPLPVFDKKNHWVIGSGSGDIGVSEKDYPNIHRALEYGDAKMNHQSREDSVGDFITSQAIVGALSNKHGQNTGRMLDYMDSRMNHMSMKDSYEFIRGELKK